MSGATLTVKVDDADLRELLGRLAKRAALLQPALEDVGQHLVHTTWQRFAEARAPDGAAWQGLSPLTRALKRIDKILIESSRLRDSINWRVQGGAVLVGSNAVYAAIHQNGGTIKPKTPGGFLVFPIGRAHVMGKRGKPIKKQGPLMYAHAREVHIPARPFLGVSNRDMEAIKTLLLDHLLGRDGKSP